LRVGSNFPELSGTTLAKNNFMDISLLERTL